jgi:hypothetical protein
MRNPKGERQKSKNPTLAGKVFNLSTGTLLWRGLCPIVIYKHYGQQNSRYNPLSRSWCVVLLFSVFYAPYVLFTSSFNGTFIIASLGILTYVGAGICLFLLSRPLAALVVMGLDPNRTLPPPPPTFKNS